MALVRETDTCSDLSQRQLRGREKRFCALYAELKYVSLRRHPGRLLELTVEMERTHRSGGRELREQHGLIRVSLDEILYAPKLGCK